MQPGAAPAPAGRPDDRPDGRILRLIDLAPDETVVVRCACGRITEYRRGFLQRHHRGPSDTLIYDLQFRLRCAQCNRVSGFEISVIDERHRGAGSQPRAERIIVRKEP
jgi:hypothetical protein